MSAGLLTGACEQQCTLLVNQHTCTLVNSVCMPCALIHVNPHVAEQSCVAEEQFIAIKHVCGAVCGAVPP